MTEEDAEDWISHCFGSTAVDKLNPYANMLRSASRSQNLISAATLDQIWARHFVDSAQLLHIAPARWEHWVDMGSGAGLPGLVIALLDRRHIRLIEPRKLRADFLSECCNALDLPHVTVCRSRAERTDFPRKPSVVSARAVAKLTELLSMARAFTTLDTVFILPKGHSASIEVALAEQSWHGMFHVKQSIVDPTSGIVVASNVRPR